MIMKFSKTRIVYLKIIQSNQFVQVIQLTYCYSKPFYVCYLSYFLKVVSTRKNGFHLSLSVFFFVNYSVVLLVKNNASFHVYLKLKAKPLYPHGTN